MTLGEVFNALAYVVGGIVFWLAARSRNTATNGIAIVVMIGLIAAVFGAKMTQLVFEGWPVRVPASAALDPRNGGRALLAGLIFGWLGVDLAKRRLGIRRSTGDLFALALPAGEAVGRIGCFLNGCCYGSVCDLPWAVNQHGALRHPTQLYSAVVAAVTFVVLAWMWVRHRTTMEEGTLFKAYLAIFAVTRFFLEFVRQRESVILGLSPMQWFCMELLAGVLIAGIVAQRRAKREEIAT